MATGIRVVPGDNGPAIELASVNVRCPSYVAKNEFDKDGSGGSSITRNFPIKAVAGSTCFTIPDTTVLLAMAPPPNLLQNVVWLSNLSTSPTAVTAKFTGNYIVKQWLSRLCTLRTYQILPATANQGFAANGARYGLKLSNGSTNFFEVTDQALVGQCVWKSTQQAGNTNGWITIPAGGWVAPNVAGFDKSRFLIFTHFNTPGVYMDYDPNSFKLTPYHASGVDSAPTSVQAQIVIFCDGAPVPAHNGGITIRNAAGTVTFSTAKAPFLLHGMVNSGGNAALPGIKRLMIPIIRTGAVVDQNGGWYNYYYRGINISQNVITTGRTGRQGRDTDQYGAVLNKPGVTVNVSLPAIDAANYM